MVKTDEFRRRSTEAGWSDVSIDHRNGRNGVPDGPIGGSSIQSGQPHVCSMGRSCRLGLSEIKARWCSTAAPEPRYLHTPRSRAELA